MKMPELWELIALFESEPKLMFDNGSEVPWFYNTLLFSLERENSKLNIFISPANCSISFELTVCGSRVLDISLQNVHEIRIQKEKGNEILFIDFADEDNIEEFYIQTRPYLFIKCSKCRY